jgi:hypothetical protein
MNHDTICCTLIQSKKRADFCGAAQVLAAGLAVAKLTWSPVLMQVENYHHYPEHLLAYTKLTISWLAWPVLWQVEHKQVDHCFEVVLD